jgi:hypothetical protein
MRWSWPVVTSVALAACGGGGFTAPSDDRAPFDFSFTDPAGDTLPPAPAPPVLPKGVDLLGVSGAVTEDQIRLTLEFAEPVAPWSARRPNSLDGFIDLDLDEDEQTGVPGAAEQASRDAAVGVEYYVDLRDSRPGRVALVDPRARAVVYVSVRFDGTTVTIEIPRSELGDDDGELLLSIVVGVADRPITDFGPDDTHYVVHAPTPP